MSAPSASDEVLGRYRLTMRRRRRAYYLVIAVVVAALAAWVGVSWSRGEVAHASLHTRVPAPPSLAAESPAPDLRLAWRTGERAALGSPQFGGTVITYSEHGVGGRDARTGARTWTYTRTDRVVCAAAQAGGTTMAIYDHAGNCDEVSAFDSGTGRRQWTRTLDMDGMPVNGRPSYQVTADTLVVASADVVYAIDPASGYNRWTYERYGCHLDHVVLGSAGALISQDCSAQVRCSGVKFCGRGPQLLLRDASAARGDDSKPNADQIKWNDVGNADTPASADDLISAVSPDGRGLAVLDAPTGRTTRTVALRPTASAPGSVAAAATTDAEIVSIAGRTYAVRADGTVEWATSTSGPATVTSTTGQVPPGLTTARITAATSRGIAQLDGADGKPRPAATVAAPAPGSLVYPLGAGFLVAGPAGTVAYR